MNNMSLCVWDIEIEIERGGEWVDMNTFNRE